MDEDKKEKKIKNLVPYLAFSIGGATFAPMLFFGVIGYYVDRHYGTKPLYLLIGIGVAFIVSNILLIRQSKTVARIYSKKS